MTACGAVCGCVCVCLSLMLWQCLFTGVSAFVLSRALQERSGKEQSQCWLPSVFHMQHTLSEHLTGVTQLVCKLYSVIHATCLPHELESVLIIGIILITCCPLESVTYSSEYICA